MQSLDYTRSCSAEKRILFSECRPSRRTCTGVRQPFTIVRAHSIIIGFEFDVQLYVPLIISESHQLAAKPAKRV